MNNIFQTKYYSQFWILFRNRRSHKKATKQKIRQRISCLVLASSFLIPFGCERSIDWEVSDDMDPQLVVEAILTNEMRIQEINLSTSFSNLNDETGAISDARITVEANNVTYTFIPEVSVQGRYASLDSFAVLAGLDYRLIINWRGEEFTATSSLSAVAPLPDFEFGRLSQQDSVFIDNNVVPLFSATQQAMYQFDVDWSHLYNEGSNQARMYFYTFNTVHNSQFIRPESEPVVFPIGSIITATKYGLNDDFANFLQGQVIETDWNGPIIYANPENAEGNISNGGLGFFTTCAVLRQTFLAE